MPDPICLSPTDHSMGEDLDVQSYVVIEHAPRAVFKDQAEARRLRANSSTRKQRHICKGTIKHVPKQVA